MRALHALHIHKHSYKHIHTHTPNALIHKLGYRTWTTKSNEEQEKEEKKKKKNNSHSEIKETLFSICISAPSSFHIKWRCPFLIFFFHQFFWPETKTWSGPQKIHFDRYAQWLHQLIKVFNLSTNPKGIHDYYLLKCLHMSSSYNIWLSKTDADSVSAHSICTIVQFVCIIMLRMKDISNRGI